MTPSTDRVGVKCRHARPGDGHVDTVPVSWGWRAKVV